ncbi:pyrroline-5-carboxylate reductase dimerization-domain-containing protein [Aspergillus avenaceus]|uniref:Pyrroline-5-carboxylate reductase dimerization-domain-containing protein n=1 Tax=Aspergillus avenaceus TaxID=36643 RepID=A0A5N6TLW5_ASPAV|nr:pyrroline-5-carboxylate reductase dimerization-domain-containing protein [Aspergillus avenaceus]
MPTLAFIGCGNMGSAILSGLLDATRQSPTTAKITDFIVNTKTAESATALRTTYQADASRVTVTNGQNVRAMQEADIIMLGCKPFLAEGILSEPGVAGALAGKFVISVMGGKTPAQILEFILQGAETRELEKPVITRAIPNVAARLRKSMTIVERNSELSEDRAEILAWVFEQIGKVKFLEPEQVDVGSMLMATAALMCVPVDGILDGCVIEGLRRPEALEMTAQCLEGMAGLLREGVHPAVLRESVSSPRGCTIQGLHTLEKQGVRGTFADAIVNGTKHFRGEK